MTQRCSQTRYIWGSISDKQCNLQQWHRGAVRPDTFETQYLTNTAICSNGTEVQSDQIQLRLNIWQTVQSAAMAQRCRQTRYSWGSISGKHCNLQQWHRGVVRPGTLEAQYLANSAICSNDTEVQTDQIQLRLNIRQTLQSAAMAQRCSQTRYIWGSISVSYTHLTLPTKRIV